MNYRRKYYVKIEKDNGFVIIEASSLERLRRELSNYFWGNLNGFWYHWNKRQIKDIFVFHY